MEKITTDRACVLVFAKISAAISHEIKNTLSIINENAGLLEDYAHMAEGGGGVSLEQVRSVTQTIAKQVERSNIIMKNLNRFAHSADTCLAHGNLSETLSLVMALSDRQAAMKNITITLDCPADVALSTYLISFESLVYLTLLTLFQNSVEGSTLAIKAVNDPPNVSLSFTTKLKDGVVLDGYPDADQKMLAAQLQASWRTEGDKLFLSLPAVMG